MIQVSHTLRAIAGAVALLAACQVQAAGGGATLRLSGQGGGAAVVPGVLSDAVVGVAGISSVGALGAAGNTVLTVNVGANASVIGIGWDVNVTAIDPSWLSELSVGFGSSTTGAVNLRVGVGDDMPGTASYNSGGFVDLIGLGLNFNVNADGVLRMEFFESFDDSSVSPDGFWNSGALTIQVAAIPEPATYGLMALGLFAVGAAARRRQS